MTVLQRQTAGGVDSHGLRKNVIAVAMAVVGLGAAFGLSQVMGSDSPQLAANEARIEAGAAYGAALEKAAELRAREQAGAAYGAALESASQSNVWSLDDELAAIRKGKTSVGSAAIAANASGLVDELDAIRGGMSSVGSLAIAENSTGLGWELEQINGGGTTSGDAGTAVRIRHNFK